MKGLLYWASRFMFAVLFTLALVFLEVAWLMLIFRIGGVI